MADIELLRPKTKELCYLLIQKCKDNGINISIIETYRSNEIQTAYFLQGRKDLETVNEARKKAKLRPLTENENKKRITNANAGQSPHNYSLAFDICPIIEGKLAWNRLDLFDKIGEMSRDLIIDGYKLKWGGDFISIIDKPHFEMENWRNYI